MINPFMTRDAQARFALLGDFRGDRKTGDWMESYKPAARAVRGAVEKQVMGALDANRDGGVSLDELSKAGKATTSSTELAGRKALFAESDRDGNGVLSGYELTESRLFDSKSLAVLIGAQGEDGVGEVLVGRGDQDGDGLLSQAEYGRIAADQIRGSGHFEEMADGRFVCVWDMESQAEIQASDFKRLDADQDGKLSAHELATNLVDGRSSDFVYGQSSKAETVGYLVDSQDQDADGALTVEELAAAADKAGLKAFDAASVIEAGDTDKDGKLSRAEALELRAGRTELFEGRPDGGGEGTAGEASLARLALATSRGLGADVAASFGALEFEPVTDAPAPTLYETGDKLSVAAARDMHVTAFSDIRSTYDSDKDAALSLSELVEAARSVGLANLDVEGMLKELDRDQDGKLSGADLRNQFSRWVMASHRGEVSKLDALSSGEASLVNLLRTVQRGAWTPPPGSAVNQTA